MWPQERWAEQQGVHVTGSRTRGWGWYIVYKSFGRKIGNSSGGCGVLPFHMGRTWFKLAVTSPNWFLLVVLHDKWTVWHGLSHHFRFRTLTMQMCCWIVDIMANLCSKLYCEVLLKSGNYIVYLLKWTSALDFNKRGCVKWIWVD